MLSLGAYVERAYPYVIGFLMAIFTYLYGEQALKESQQATVDVKAFFAAFFDIATILTGFLFAFFGLALAPGGGFIEKLIGTRTFSIFRRYVAEALGFGFMLIFISIPFMISTSYVDNLSIGWHMLLVVWSFVATASIFCFFRVGRIFLIWIGVGARPFRALRETG